MKNLWTIPAGIALLAVLAAGLFYSQLNRFERSHLDSAALALEREAVLAGYVVSPYLEAGDIAPAQRFCDEFRHGGLRLSLIAPDGRVIADSRENAALLDNHRDREEVTRALAGEAASSMRYSSTLNAWMLYCAVPVAAPDGVYVLRAAVSSEQVSAMIALAKLNMLLALLFGMAVALLLAVYLVNRIRRPLLLLRQSVKAVADGDFATPIAVPESGPLRELARGVADMAAQLNRELARSEDDRHAKEVIFDAMTEAVLLIAADGRIVRSNQAAAALFRWREAESLNLARLGIAELLPEVRRCFLESSGFEREFELRRSGLTLALLIRGRPVSDAGVRYLLLSVTDLTSLRRLESFRSDFIANVSHELKTPLTSIIGAVEALQAEPEYHPERFARLLEILGGQSVRLDHLIRDILSLAGLERKELNDTGDFAPVDLAEVLAEAAQNSRGNPETVICVTAPAPVMVDGDRQLLEQAVENLIANAVKYSGSPRIDLEARLEEGRPVLTVRDYGCGIPDEHRGRIFERFYRINKERSRKLGGTGLGLAIVKHIALLHKGSVEFSETPGGGSTFTLRLPPAGENNPDRS